MPNIYFWHIFKHQSKKKTQVTSYIIMLWHEIKEMNYHLQLLLRDSKQTKTVACCGSELTRKRFLVLNSPLSEWHWFIHSVISMHTTLAASNHRQSSPLVTAVLRTGSHQTIESEHYSNTAILILSKSFVQLHSFLFVTHRFFSPN